VGAWVVLPMATVDTPVTPTLSYTSCQ
jgi:hypothetical protein